jgi:hypothetical protein
MIFEPGISIYFSTYPPPTLIHLSYRFTSASKPAASSQPLSHLRFNLFHHQRNVCHPAVNRFTRQTLPTVNRKHFFMNILCIEPFCPQKNAQQNAALRYYSLQAPSPFWLLKPASEHVHARLLPRLSWSWTVLLPSDTHRKPIKSITTVLLPFVTYFLILPRMWVISWRCQLL